ncbi:MAG: DPP IV N-terminal domain-containing protein [Planctomycetota bacterium]
MTAKQPTLAEPLAKVEIKMTDMRLASLTLILISAVTAWSQTESADGSAETSASDTSQITVTRICTDKDFKTKSFGPSEWLNDGDAYTTVEEVANAKVEDDEDPPKEIVKYDTAAGTREVLVSVAQLTPPGKDKPLELDNYDWSKDKTKLLIFTNTVKVWRDNTRGDYWVLDLKTGSLRQIAPKAEPSTLMFAKLSPDATRVAYVRENNIYVESLINGGTIPLTIDGTKTLINGTFDWVYEEELGLQDGFRWSPDGQRIAYWQLDASVIKTFYMINNTDENYPKLIPLPYPKVGERNSSARIGVVSANGGSTRWMAMPGDPSENYLASLEWVADSRNLLIEQLNRLQNRRVLWRVDAATGSGTSIYTDQNKSWIDMRQKFPWYKSDSHRLVLSESDGWRHAYRVSVADGGTNKLTPGEYDVIDLIGNDKQSLYFTASPTDPIRQYLYRAPLSGGPSERLTPEDQVGFHTYNAAPNGRWAIHTYSAMGKPPVIDLVELPSHRSVRVLEDA